ARVGVGRRKDRAVLPGPLPTWLGVAGVVAFGGHAIAVGWFAFRKTAHSASPARWRAPASALLWASTRTVNGKGPLPCASPIFALKHFPPKRTPVRRRKCDKRMESKAHPGSLSSKTDSI